MGRVFRYYAVLGAAYFLVLEAALWVAIYFWPDFEANLGAFRLLTQIKVIRGLISVLKEGEYPGYVVMQHFFKDCNLLGTMAAVLFAVSSIAAEAHRGTLEILLARPHSRLRILMERYVAGAVALVVPVFLTTWTIPALSSEVEETIALAPLMLGAVHMSCMLLAVYSATFFCSTVGRHPIRIAATVLFLAVFEMSTYFVMQMTNWSVVRFVDPRHFVEIFTTGELDWTICGGLLGFSFVATLASWVAFSRRVP